MQHSDCSTLNCNTCLSSSTSKCLDNCRPICVKNSISVIIVAVIGWWCATYVTCRGVAGVVEVFCTAGVIWLLHWDDVGLRAFWQDETVQSVTSVLRESVIESNSAAVHHCAPGARSAVWTITRLHHTPDNHEESLFVLCFSAYWNRCQLCMSACCVHWNTKN